MTEQNPLFSVESDWCGTCILTLERWEHVIVRHPEVAPYMEQIERAVGRPNLVYETPHVKPTRTFYARGLIDDPRFRDCYVAVFVRHTMEPSQVWTAYLPFRLSKNPGKLIHAGK